MALRACGLGCDPVHPSIDGALHAHRLPRVDRAGRLGTRPLDCAAGPAARRPADALRGRRVCALELRGMNRPITMGARPRSLSRTTVMAALAAMVLLCSVALDLLLLPHDGILGRDF